MDQRGGRRTTSECSSEIEVGKLATTRFRANVRLIVTEVDELQ